MRSRRIRRVPSRLVSLTLAVLCAPACLMSQTGVQDPNTATALTYYASFSGGNLDRINALNGQLTLDIPIVSYPQRGGKLKLDLKMRYENRGAWTIEDQIDDGTNNHEQVDPNSAIAFDHGFFITEAGGPTLWSTKGVDYTDPSVCDECEGNQQLDVNFSVWVETSDGGYHKMAPTQAFTYASSSTPIAWRSTDGSGFLANLAYNDLSTNPYPSLMSNTIFGPDGTQYQGAASTLATVDSTSGENSLPALRQDANGNKITYGNGWSDTLGRTIPLPDAINASGSGCASSSASAKEWLLPGPVSAVYRLVLCYGSVNEESRSLDNNGNPVTNDYTAHPLTQIILPNGSSWNFQYSNDLLGDLRIVTLPTGGTISYTWINQSIANSPGRSYQFTRTVQARTVDPHTAGNAAGTQTYCYKTLSYTGNGPSNQTFITDAAGNDVVHSFGAQSGQFLFPEEDSITYYSGSTAACAGGGGNASALETVATTYASGTIATFPTKVLTTLNDTNQQSSSGTGYDSSLPIFPDTIYTCCGYINPTSPTYGSFGLVTSNTVTDFGTGGPGGVLQGTVTDFLALHGDPTGQSYLGANFLNLPNMVTVGGSLGESAVSTYGYDGSTVISSGVSTAVTALSSSAIRGNLTSVTRSHSGSTITSTSGCPSTSASSSITYYDSGTVYQSVDPCTRQTKFSYSATYVGAFPTTVTKLDPLGGASQVATMGYDFNTGQLTDRTDTNGVTTHERLDCMGRVFEVDYNYPDTNSGKLQSVYNDGTGSSSCSSATGQPNSVTIKQQLDGTRIMQTEVDVDGFGRQTQTRSTHPSGVISTWTYYDSMGRKASQYNPSRCSSPVGCAESTAGQTTFTYDALGRLRVQTMPGGGTQQTAYSGNRVDFQDAELRTWRRLSDGLGRVTDVYEDPNGANLHTSYVYDGLSNLKQVTQAGAFGLPARTFNYDGLSRLMSAFNPETGTICYGSGNAAAGSCDLNGYDAAGNLVKSSDSNGKVVAYAYDGFDRLVSKQYMDATPSECFTYGGATYGFGRLSVQWTQTGSCSSSLPSAPLTSRQIQSYNFRGQVTAETQCVLQMCTPGSSSSGLTYQYDVAGDLTQFALPGASTSYYLRNHYDLAGRLSAVHYGTSVSNGSLDQPLSTVESMSPAGAVTGASIGSHLTVTKSYDNQLRPIGLDTDIQ